MDAKQAVVLAFQASILCTLFGLGLSATSRDLWYVLRRPGLFARSLLAMLVIMPAVAIAMARMFDFRSTVEIALVALALSPVPPLLPRREIKAGGERPYGLGLMATLALLSIVSIPLSIEILERGLGRSFAMTPGPIAKVVLTFVLLPLLAGVAVRALRPGSADRIARLVSWVPKILLPLAGVALLAGTWRLVWAAIGEGTLVAILVFVTAGLVVGHVLGGPEPEHSLVLALSSACRHPAIALSIAAANYPDLRFGGTILLYLIASLAVTMLYVAWQRQRAPRVARTRPHDRRAA
jgi:BASS family bile acid:Na+ symporter